MEKIKEFVSNAWFWVRFVGFIAICGVVFGTIEMIADGDMNIKEFLSNNFSIIEEIEKEAYEKGFVDGRDEGREESVHNSDKNYESGYEKGLTDGEKNSSEAYEDGYVDGYTKGYSEGKAAGTSSASQSSGSSGSSGKSGGSGGSGTSGSFSGSGGNTYYGPVAESCDYVLNTNTGKFHKPSCSSATNIKPENREYFTGTREEVIARGFDPCGRCNP